jgi:methyl-accepting chemotaxis protein
MSERENCWERVKCGREDSCPAHPDHGRECFAVTATMCRGEEQGSYEQKIEKCRVCQFYLDLMSGGREDLW